MASITIRNLYEQTKTRLRVRAAHHKRSMEEEARHILRVSLSEDRTIPSNLGEAIGRRFAPLGGVDLPLPPQGPLRGPSKLGSHAEIELWLEGLGKPKRPRRR